MAQAVGIVVQCGAARIAYTTAPTSSSYTTRLATTTRPVLSATRAIFDRKEVNNPGTICIVPFATATNNQTGSVKVIGWNVTVTGLYVPEFVCDVACTFSSTLVGVVGADVTDVMLFADILSLTNGIAVLRQGTGDVDTASFLADVGGFELVEVECKVGTATDTNALVRFQN